MHNMENQVGVRIGVYHTWSDFKLYLKKIYISEAKEKITDEDIPGTDGRVNCSNFGTPVYDNRILQFEFDAEDGGYPGHYKLSSNLRNAFQGGEKRIILDEDNEFFWMGRVEVNVQKKNSIISSVIVVCTVNPYKFKVDKTIVTKNVLLQEEINCKNIKKRVVPKITTDAEFELIKDGVIYTAKAGERFFPDLLLTEGDNFITCTGKGTISFEYQEGSL